MFVQLFRRVLIRQHKAQMKRKSKEIQESLVRNNCSQLIRGPQCVYVSTVKSDFCIKFLKFSWYMNLFRRY